MGAVSYCPVGANLIYCISITDWEGQALEERYTGAAGGRRLATGKSGRYEGPKGRRKAKAYDWENDSADCRVPDYDNYVYRSDDRYEEYYDEEPSRDSYEPRRRQSGRPKKAKARKQSGGRRFLKGLYRTVTVLSAIIVIGYLGVTLAIRPPEQTGPTPPPVDQPTDPNALVRRDKTYTVLLAATDEAGVRTDTMIVATYDVKQQKVGMVSIPRDTLICRREGNPKLVYGKGGVQQRVKDISDMLGIPIDFYVKVDIRGFIALVDYVGGIDFYVPCDMDYDDPYQGGKGGLHIHFREGMQHLSGQEAMEVARFRKNNDHSGYSDVGRTQTQQQLLIALAKKVISWDSVTKINGFVEIFNEYVETNMKLSDMMYFASKGVQLDTESGVETATLEGRGDAIYRGTKFCYELDQTKTLETVNRLLNPYTRELTQQDMNLCRADKYMSN